MADYDWTRFTLRINVSPALKHCTRHGLPGEVLKAGSCG